ncbi:MAG: FprA family A-type flavoprotein [Rikenellaceae bacterium]|nr:FprA family A-type flavoprotein [Rikenellaceae bacterium]
MYSRINVSERVFYLGVNDRRKQLFENIWPLPDGVSYNSYLIRDEQTALVDTVEMGTAGDYTGWVRYLLEGKPLDYLIINHMEPDHAGEIGHVVQSFPEVKILGNSKTFPLLKAFFGLDSNLNEVNEGDELDLGHHKLKFFLTPWVHWPETMMTYDRTEKLLFSGDAFGTFGALDGAIFDDELDFSKYEGEMLRYYSNIVGKYSNMVQKAFAKLSGVEVKTICSVHGPVWRAHPEKVMGLYDQWSRQEPDESVVIAYATMYGNNAALADYVARKLTEQGIRNIKVYDVSKTHFSYIIRDAWKAKGIVLGTCSYNTEMFPLMKQLTHEFELLGMKNKKLAIFGTHSWNGCGAKDLNKFAETIGWDLVTAPMDIHGRPTPDKVRDCDALATTFAAKLKE